MSWWGRPDCQRNEINKVFILNQYLLRIWNHIHYWIIFSYLLGIRNHIHYWIIFSYLLEIRNHIHYWIIFSYLVKIMNHVYYWITFSYLLGIRNPENKNTNRACFYGRKCWATVYKKKCGIKICQTSLRNKLSRYIFSWGKLRGASNTIHTQDIKLELHFNNKIDSVYHQ